MEEPVEKLGSTHWHAVAMLSTMGNTVNVSKDYITDIFLMDFFCRFYRSWVLVVVVVAEVMVIARVIVKINNHVGLDVFVTLFSQETNVWIVMYTRIATEATANVDLASKEVDLKEIVKKVSVIKCSYTN